LADGAREERATSSDRYELVSLGLKSFHVKKLEHWCEAVSTRADNMLSSSLNTPATASLLSSESLTVMTLPAHSATVAESVSDNDSEDDVSDNDLEILDEQSDTSDVAGDTNSTGGTSGGTETPAKKTKIMMTEQEHEFVKKFQPTASKTDKTRKVLLRHVSGRGASGGRKHDVKPETLKTCLLQFADQFLQVQGGHLYWTAPNSSPPKSLFSIFNTTYNDDQKSSQADYIILSIQSHFNKRAL
jgi:hypothetical protein